MPAMSQRPNFADPKLRAEMAPLRVVDNVTNLLYLSGVRQPARRDRRHDYRRGVWRIVGVALVLERPRSSLLRSCWWEACSTVWPVSGTRLRTTRS